MSTAFAMSAVSAVLQHFLQNALSSVTMFGGAVTISSKARICFNMTSSTARRSRTKSISSPSSHLQPRLAQRWPAIARRRRQKSSQ